MPQGVSERILVLAPRGRDSEVACGMLREAGIDAEPVPSNARLVEELAAGAGVAVVTEEALRTGDLHPLSAWIAAQPEWSDFPFILLTGRGGGLERNPEAERFLRILGNVSFLERPFHPTTFVSLAEAALRGRRRQYDARTRLEELRANESHARAIAERLREESQNLEILNRTGADLAILLDRSEAVQRVTDAGVELSGAQYGAFFHNVLDENGRSYMLYTLSGETGSALEKFPMPRATAVFEPTFLGSGIIRSDDITKDERYGRNEPHLGIPEGHPPVRSYLAVPVRSRFGTVIGGLFFGHREPGRFSERHESLISGLAGQAAVTLDNADLFQAAERELEVRRRTEAELKASNDRFRAAIDAVQGVLWTNNARGEMEGDQPSWAALTGQSREEYEGHGWSRVVHPDDAGPTIEAWKRAVAERRTFVFEHRLLRHDGEWRNYSIRAVPILDDAGEILQWVGVHTDITAQRAAEAALMKLNARLESRVVEEANEREQAEEQLRQVQKMDAVGQLTGGIAHDFNNLLTPILGGLDLLRSRLKEDERAQRTIAMSIQAATRATNLVQRLLAFARRQDLQPRPVDVSALVLGVRELIARSIGPQVSIEIEAAPDLPAALVDPNQLELAILNLAINARDAMPGGGRIEIAVGESRLERHEHGLAAGRYIHVSVGDEGVGMDRDTLRRATEPFFSTKGTGKGTGLGLSMVHGLAAQSGGALRLTSEPGEGTRAEIWLPVASAAAIPAPEAEIIPIAARRDATILLVDDEDLVRSGTAEMLEESGYTVIQASSGAEALVILRKHRSRIDVLVTDFLMPAMNGASLAQEAQAMLPGLPVLLITGYSTLSDGPGSDLPRLAKPFRQAELAAQIAKLISARDEPGIQTARA